MIKVKNIFDFYKVRSNFLGFQKFNPNFDVNYDGLFSTFDLDNPLSKSIILLPPLITSKI